MKAWEGQGSKVSFVLAGVLTCSLRAASCSRYATGEELKSQAKVSQAETTMDGLGGKGGSVFEGQNGKNDQDWDNQGRDDQGQGDIRINTIAGITRLETEPTTVPLPVFESMDDSAYVETSGGGNVRTRSSYDAGSGSNIATYASHGIKLRRTGKSSGQARIDYNGTSCYFSSAYVTTGVVEASGAVGVSGISYADSGEVTPSPSRKYIDPSGINSGSVVPYRSDVSDRKDITVRVNAGHGTEGGSLVKILCHLDGMPEAIGSTTGVGATSAATVSDGMTFADDTAESKVTLVMTKTLKDRLPAPGYDALTIRESDDAQLDNIAKTVIANNTNDCHIALHWDFTTNNKGAFYMSAPNVDSYRNMEPVRSHWRPHSALGESLVTGLKGVGVKIFSNEVMAMDLTQIFFSTIPPMDIKLGNKVSDHSQVTPNTLTDGLLARINQYSGW